MVIWGMDFEKLGYQFRTSYERGKSVPRTYGIAMTVHKGGEEIGHLTVDRKEGPGHQYHWPGIEVDPEHQGQGLAMEMTRRIAAMHPTATFEWHDFVSEGGLGVAKKAHAENPKQHLMDEDDVVDIPPWYEEEHTPRYKGN